jgi:hypothetical protein
VPRNVYDVARDALQVSSARGLIGCEVVSESERILAWIFDSAEHAERYRCTRSRARIIPDQPTVVLVTET